MAGRLRYARRAIWLLPWLMAACNLPPSETAAEALTRRQTSCADAGFTADTPDFRLCLLLQQTNERLTAVERRLSALEQDWTLTRPYFGPWPW
jgi:hypothetical protein